MPEDYLEEYINFFTGEPCQVTHEEASYWKSISSHYADENFSFFYNDEISEKEERELERLFE